MATVAAVMLFSMVLLGGVPGSVTAKKDDAAEIARQTGICNQISQYDVRLAQIRELTDILKAGAELTEQTEADLLVLNQTITASHNQLKTLTYHNSIATLLDYINKGVFILLIGTYMLFKKK